MKNYLVPVVYTGQATFSIRANNPKEARELAERKFMNGEEEVLVGDEVENLMYIKEPIET